MPDLIFEKTHAADLKNITFNPLGVIIKIVSILDF